MMTASFPTPTALALGLTLVAGLAFGVASPAASQDTTPPPPTPPAAPSTPAVADPGDVLRPGDVVRLLVWREPAFSGEFPVDQNGQVMLPRLGAVTVTGVPTSELREQILTGLSRYLRNPSMDVMFLRRVAVYGAVSRAGLYPVDPTMTVLDALAMAGGARPDGRIDRIRLLREGEVIATIRTTGVRMEDLSIRSGDQLFVPEATWFRRNTAIVATVISTGASVLIALLYISRG
jgi:protein involved in polysaccharide export with SLBB domain